MRKINIKPLSVNECWQGRRFKTKEYKQYEKDLLLMLPNIKLKIQRVNIDIVFGFSNSLCDIDNPLKPFLDVLQKKYNINDRDIYKLIVSKEVITKGNEFIKYKITEIDGKK